METQLLQPAQTQLPSHLLLLLLYIVIIISCSSSFRKQNIAYLLVLMSNDASSSSRYIYIIPKQLPFPTYKEAREFSSVAKLSLFTDKLPACLPGKRYLASSPYMSISAIEHERSHQRVHHGKKPNPAAEPRHAVSVSSLAGMQSRELMEVLYIHLHRGGED